MLLGNQATSETQHRLVVFEIFPFETLHVSLFSKNCEGSQRQRSWNIEWHEKGHIISAARSGEGPAGEKAAAEELFTFRWGEPGRSEERELSAPLGLNPDYSSPLASALASRVLGGVMRRRRNGSIPLPGSR